MTTALAHDDIPDISDADLLRLGPIPDNALETILVGTGHEATALLVDPATGEVIDVPHSPDPSMVADASEIARYVALRRTASSDRLVGIKAEYEARKARLDAEYLPRIKREESLIAWLDNRYRDTLRAFAAAILATAKTKTVRFEGLKLSFRTTRGSIEVTDEATAITYLKAVCPGAIKVKESVAKSEIPAELFLPGEASGLRRVEPEERFYLD